MNRAELEHTLEQHKLWLETGGAEGVRADLQDADLRGANLHHAELHNANLHHADLRGANLMGADLRSVDLRSADLRDANLMGADLRVAILVGAQLDIRIRDCWSFRSAQFTPEALPWLILHPKWAEWKGVVRIIDWDINE